MAIIAEKFDSRDSVVGINNPSVELQYVILETEDDAVVRILVEATIPAFYAGLAFQDYRMTPQGGGVWFVTVRYGRLQPKQTGESSYTFDTTGASQHITQSKQTIARYAKAGEDAPDFKGAINVTDDRIEGLDINLPAFNWTETHYVPVSLVTDAYKTTLFQLTWCVNNGIFRNRAAGEVQFQGVQGSQRGQEDWELTYKFSALPNIINYTIGDINGINKKGWEYLWVRYEDVVDDVAKVLVKRPKAVYIEKVFDEASFLLLGI